MLPRRCGRCADRKSTRLNSSHANIYTLSLHDALSICQSPRHNPPGNTALGNSRKTAPGQWSYVAAPLWSVCRSEEHTSELQSRQYLHSFPTRRSFDLSKPSAQPSWKHGARQQPQDRARPVVVCCRAAVVGVLAVLFRFGGSQTSPAHGYRPGRRSGNTSSGSKDPSQKKKTQERACGDPCRHCRTSVSSLSSGLGARVSTGSDRKSTRLNS